MSRAAELLAFSGLALSAHLGLWVWVGEDGADSAGSGGDAAVSLAAATGEVAAMVEQWTAPPQAMQAALRPEPPAPMTETATPPAALSDRPVPAPPVAMPPGSAADSAPAPLAHAASPLAHPGSPAAPQAPNPPQPDAAQTAPAPETTARPLRPAMAPAASQADPLPQIDLDAATPPPDTQAPQVSLRPQRRPDGLALPAPRQPARPKQKQAAQGQTAKGTNEGRNAGTKQDKGAATLSSAQRQQLLSRWGAAIRNRVERQKRYPRGTRASGTAVLRISVSTQGHLTGATLARSSGDARLDRAALDAARRARFPAAPAGLAKSGYSFNLPMAFSAR